MGKPLIIVGDNKSPMEMVERAKLASVEHHTGVACMDSNAKVLLDALRLSQNQPLLGAGLGMPDVSELAGMGFQSLMASPWPSRPKKRPRKKPVPSDVAKRRMRNNARKKMRAKQRNKKRKR